MSGANFVNDTRGAMEPGEDSTAHTLEPTADPEKFRCSCGITVHVSESPEEAHRKKAGSKKVRR